MWCRGHLQVVAEPCPFVVFGCLPFWFVGVCRSDFFLLYPSSCEFVTLLRMVVWRVVTYIQRD